MKKKLFLICILFISFMFLGVNNCYAEEYSFDLNKWEIKDITNMFKTACSSNAGVKGAAAAESCVFNYTEAVYNINKKKFGKAKSKKIVYDPGNVNGTGIKGSKAKIVETDINCSACPGKQESTNKNVTVKRVKKDFVITFANIENVGDIVKHNDGVSNYCKKDKLKSPMDKICKDGNSVSDEAIVDNYAQKSQDKIDDILSGDQKLYDIPGDDLDTINGKLVSKDPVDPGTCEELLGEDLIKKIQEIVNIIRIAVPIMLIVFGIIDFGKAIFVSDENEMKKSQSKFIRRLIIAIGFFLVPSILQLLLKIAHSVWNFIPDTFCGIKF